LQAGDSKSNTLNIDPLCLATFNPDVNRWQIVPGDYKVMAGTSSASLPLTTAVTLDGDKTH
jgi:beta-glucosidase